MSEKLASKYQPENRNFMYNRLPIFYLTRFFKLTGLLWLGPATLEISRRVLNP
jgi:hypothetical protein